MKKIRVLFLSYNGLLEPLLYSQGLAYLRELSRTLDTEIIILSFEKVGFFASSKKMEEMSSLKEELNSENIHWYWLRYHKFPPVLSSVYDICLGFLVSAYLIYRKNITFIHARSYVPATIAYVIFKLFKISYIFDMRGFMFDDYTAMGIIREFGVIYRFAKNLEKSLLENSSYTVVLTEEASKSLRDLSKANMQNKRVEVIPCCVDTRRFSYSSTKDIILLKRMRLEDKFIFIYVGSLGKIYQFDKMLDFFNVARSIISNAHFLILTPDIDYIDSERIKHYNNRLFDNISYLTVKPHEVSKYISLGDAGIAFYLPSFSRKATSPTKIGEYLISGIPFVVNSGVGDTEKWINEFKIGAVVKDFTVESYKESINYLINLLTEKEKTRRMCREASERLLSLNIAIQKYSKIYGFFISRREGN